MVGQVVVVLVAAVEVVMEEGKEVGVVLVKRGLTLVLSGVLDWAYGWAGKNKRVRVGLVRLCLDL